MSHFDLTDLLCRLVATASVNPMGQSVSHLPEAAAEESLFYEGRLTHFLEQFLQGFGLETLRQPVAPARENLIVRLSGNPPPEQGGDILLWDAHQDTVPTQAMRIEPFTPKIQDGRLYGRGACDVKGGLAAMLGALVRLCTEPPSTVSGGKSARWPTVYLAATVDEEHGLSGARVLSQLWQNDPGGFLPRRPDAAIVAEPTELHIVVAHQGVVRWRCHTRGRACHSSQPLEGRNAIYLMADVLQALQQYAHQVVIHLGWHPLCGHPAFSVGRIYGGQSVNIVPDLCTIEIDRRLLPGESPQDAWKHAFQYLIGCLPEPEVLEQESPLLEVPPLSNQENGPLAEKLSRVASEHARRECRRTGARYTTNASFYAEAGVPTVVFGPGSIAQAHTADEWILLEQVEQAAQILYALVDQWYSLS